MTAELGGPFPREGIEAKVARDASQAAADTAWIKISWGLVHAFPAATNGPSNGICRSVGFRFAGEQDVPFAGQVIRANLWVIDPRADLT